MDYCILEISMVSLGAYCQKQTSDSLQTSYVAFQNIIIRVFNHSILNNRVLSRLTNFNQFEYNPTSLLWNISINNFIISIQTLQYVLYCWSVNVGEYI